MYLLSLNIVVSKFIRVVTCSSTSFHFMAEYYSFICIKYILLIHSSFDGLLNCFHFLAIMNNGSLNIHIQVFVWKWIINSPGYKLLDYMVTLCLAVWEIPSLFSKVAAPFYSSTNSIWGFWFFHDLPNTCYHLSFWL